MAVAGAPLTNTGLDGVARPVTVIRLDATIIEAATMKEPAVAGHYKGGIGFHRFDGVVQQYWWTTWS